MSRCFERKSPVRWSFALCIASLLSVFVTPQAFAAHYFGGEITHEILGPLGGTGTNATRLVVKATMRVYLDRSRFCNAAADGRGSCCSGLCLDTTNPRLLTGQGTFRWGTGGVRHPTLSPTSQTNRSFGPTPWKVIYEDKPGNLLGFEFVTYRLYLPTTTSTTAEWSDCCWSNAALPRVTSNGYDLKTDIAIQRGNKSPGFDGAFFVNACKQYDLTFDLRPTDPNGDPVTVSFYQPKSGGAQTKGLSLSPQGILTWPKSTITEGLWIVRVEVKDNKGATSVREFLLNVLSAANCQNRPPAVALVPPSASVAIGAKACTQVTLSDPDAANKLRVLISPRKAGATITPASATQTGRPNPTNFQYCWTPGLNDEDTTQIVQFTVYDNGSPQLNAQKNFSITVAKGTPPKIEVTPAPLQKTVVATKTITFTIKASDVESSIDKLTSSVPAWCQVTKNGNGNWSVKCTPPRSEGGKSFNLKFTVTDKDKKAKTNSLTVVLKVDRFNRPPTIVDPGAQTLPHGVAFTLKLSASDPDGDPLTYAVTGLPAGATIDSMTGELKWTPTAADVKAHTAEFSVDDGAPGGLVKQSVTFTVTNAPPKLSGTPPTIAYVGGAYAYGPTVQDPNPGDTFTWSYTGPTGAAFDQMTGKMTWTPVAADLGKKMQVEIKVCDANNACDSQTFSIDVGQKCTFDRDCGLPAWICSDTSGQRLCIPAGCADPAQMCKPNELCTVATCNADPCASIQCKTGEYCDPAQGKCVNACPHCNVGERCNDQATACEPDPCATVKCAKGEACVKGKCEKDACTNGTGQCRFTRICTSGKCTDDPCLRVNCPVPTVCLEGRCILPPKPEPVPEPEPASEPLPEPEPLTEFFPEPEPLTEPTPEPKAEPAPEPTDAGLDVAPEPAKEPVQDASSDGTGTDVADSTTGSEGAQEANLADDPLSITGGCAACNGGSSLPTPTALLFLFLVLCWCLRLRRSSADSSRP